MSQNCLMTTVEIVLVPIVTFSNVAITVMNYRPLTMQKVY